MLQQLNEAISITCSLSESPNNFKRLARGPVGEAIAGFRSWSGPDCDDSFSSKVS